MKTSITFAILMTSLTFPVLRCNAQDEFAIVNKSVETVTVQSQNSYTWEKHVEFQINNEKSKDLADFNMSVSNDTKLDKLTCTISTLDGRVLKKYEKSDVKQSEYSTELASDEFLKFLDVDLPSFPVVVTYGIKTHQTNNVLSYPTFKPVLGYDMAVKEATYSIIAPPEVPIKYSQLFSQLKPTESVDAKGRKVIKFEVTNFNPVKKEDFARPINEFIPIVYFVPEKIEYFKTTASMESWEEFGKWIWGLTESQTVLPDNIKAKIHSLTDGLSTNREKIAALYKYLGETTRYVSIQLGIGGFKPMDPALVCKYGFGDCKALTNLMKLMLREIGIKSFYTQISTEYRTLLKDCPNFLQINHVILNVPDSQGDLWLECTNPSLPLGYIHQDIAGHEALLITEDGGKLITLPNYNSDQNYNYSDMKMKLHADGKADVSLTDSYEYHLYNALCSLPKASQKEQKDDITSLYKLPFAELKSVAITDDSKPYGTPEITIKTEASGVKIANISGSRLFVTMNPMHTESSLSNIAKNRVNDIYIEDGRKVVESVELEYPEGMKVESNLQLPSCENELGEFLAKTTNVGNKIKLETSLLLHKGTYGKEKAALFDELINASRAVYTLKVILKKE